MDSVGSILEACDFRCAIRSAQTTQWYSIWQSVHLKLPVAVFLTPQSNMTTDHARPVFINSDD